MSSEKLETANVIAEIQDLQYDMQKWIRGEFEEDYSRFSQRQAIDLTVISTKGMYQTRTDFNERYETLFGKYPDAKLSAEIIRTKRLSDQMLMAVYHQKTSMNGKSTNRITTAIFRYKEDLKNNAEWIHVHTSLEIKSN